MNKKTIIILIAVIAIAAAGLYAWKEFNRKNEDLTEVKAAFIVNANGLINEFTQNDSASNAKYLGKIVTVEGVVKKVENDDYGHHTIVLGDSVNMSSVRCAVDSTHAADATVLQRGQSVKIKGFFTGFKKDETGLLGSDVELNRCVIEKN